MYPRISLLRLDKPVHSNKSELLFATDSDGVYLLYGEGRCVCRGKGREEISLEPFLAERRRFP
jgi:hypothetical protein